MWMASAAMSVAAIPTATATGSKSRRPPRLAPLHHSKGSIAIDGISLTVAELAGRDVGVQIVPFTFATHGAARVRAPGDAVNLEADVIGKYVARCMGRSLATGAAVDRRISCEPDRCSSRKARKRKSPFATVDEAIDAIRDGRMIIVVDDEDRENEGDLTMAASTVTPEAVNFMVTHGRGLVCLAMTPERLDQLDIPLEVSDNSSPSRHGDVRVDRRQGRHDDGRFGRRPRADDSGGDRTRHEAARSRAARPRVSAARAARAACSSGRDTPKRRSTWRGSRACRRPA